LRIHDDDLLRAYKNLSQDQINYLSATMAMDGSMNFRQQMMDQQTRLYYAGQVPTSNWLNPIAWAKFVQAWQNGDFKRKDKKPKHED
jgi:hypothetical protein